MDLLSLFSGIGGFSRAWKWCGGTTIQMVEIDPFCRKVLQKNFPGVPIHDDIKTFTWAGERPFIIAGGPPCQPASVAGKRAGDKDDRWLWPEALRLVSEVRPQWCIFENPTGILSLKGGFLFENLLLALEDQGYAVQAFIIPACAIGAPHRRDRVWIVANLRCDGCGKRNSSLPGQESGTAFLGDTDRRAPDASIKDDRGYLRGTEERQESEPGNGIEPSSSPDSILQGPQGRGILGESETGRPSQGSVGYDLTGCDRNAWDEPWPETAARLCTLDVRLPGGLARPKGWRVNALKAVGNTIVPQIAYIIMKAILESTDGIR